MDGYSILMLSTSLLCFGLGVMAVARHAGRAGRLWFGVSAISMAFWQFAVGSVRVSPVLSIALDRVRAAGLIAALLPIPWTIVSLVLARERGRAVVRRWRPYLAAIVGLSIYFGVSCYTGGVFFGIDWGANDGYLIILGPAGRYMLIYLIVAMVVVLFNLEVTVRCATSVALGRIKYAVVGLAAAMIFHLFVLSVALLYSVVRMSYLVAGSVPILAAALLTGYSVSRLRLTDASVRVGRPVFYTSITVILSGIYLLTVGLLGRFVRAQGWHLWTPLIMASVFVLILVLVMVLVSAGAKRQIRRFVDANFYLNRYDYRREWERATRQLSSELDLDRLVPHVLNLLAETLDCEDVWLLTVSREEGACRLRSFFRDDERLTRALEDPLLLSRLVERAEVLRIHPDECEPELTKWVDEHGDLLREEGARLAVPLVGAGQFVGVAVVGERRTGARYTIEDVGLLTTLGIQIGHAILVGRLAERLAAARELESFHRLSSFVVHDLKNCVSGLSMTLQNADRNIAEPAFQKDLLATVHESVGTMEKLIEKMSSVPSLADMSRESCDLADVVGGAMSRVGLSGPDCGVATRIELKGAPNVIGDRNALERVFANLLANSVEAMEERGELTVRARSGRDGSVLVTLSDSGPGIRDDLLLADSLFKPFVTSKRGGLGLGLYHTRLIIEALGGQIEARNGKGGAVFVMQLPCA